MFCKVNVLNDDNILKIKLSEISWEELFENKEYLYSKIADLLLNEENILYYVTQRESSKTLSDTRKYIKKLIANKTLNINIDQILNTIGWNENVNINSPIFQGDLGEFLMSIFIDKLTPIETLISKISFKTSPNMSVFGNDNYYYDYENEVLYFGEAKFYSDAEVALTKALNSITEHSNVEEIMFVKDHTSAFIADNNEKRMKIVEEYDEISIDNIKTKNIIFIMNDNVYRKKDYEEMLINYFGGLGNVKEKTIEIIFVFFPVLSKPEFLQYFYRRIAHGRK